MMKSLFVVLAVAAAAVPAVAFAERDSDSNTFRNQSQCLRAIAHGGERENESGEGRRGRRAPTPPPAGNLTCQQNADGTWSIVSAAIGGGGGNLPA